MNDKILIEMDNAPILWRQIDTNGIIINCNKSYAKTLDYSKSEIIGKSIFDFVVDETKENLKQSFETWKKTGKISTMEVWLKRKDGKKIPTFLNANNFYDKEGNLIGSNTMLFDISKIKTANTEVPWFQIKKLQTIGELSSRIAHDFRNPVSIIKNSIELIKATTYNNLDGYTKDHFDRIQRAVIRITHQVVNVLDHINPKPLLIEDTTIFTVINSAIESLRVPENVSIYLLKNDIDIRVDSLKLEIVFINLISNAIQAMNFDGEIQIEVTEEDDHIIISVKDDGPGIPPDKLPKIFEPLFTTRQVGTGLGLTSCKTIVEQHGGTITVQSKRGEGTTFIIKLPEFGKTRQLPPKAQLVEKIPTASLPSTLIIEDDPDLVDVMTSVLKVYNVPIVGFGYNGKDAVELYAKLKPQIVLLDILMPEYDGFYAIEKIREIDPNAKFVVTTGDIRPKTLEKLENFDVEIIYKPFEPKQFILAAWKIRKSISGE